MTTKWTRLRIAIVGAVLGVLALCVVTESIRVVVMPVDLPGGPRMLRELGETNSLKKIELPARRGRVLDRHGLELAATADFDRAVCNPRQLAHVPDGPKRIAKVLGMTERDVREVLRAREGKAYAVLKLWISEEEAAALAGLAIPGVRSEKHARRVYPYGDLAATVIGHTNKEGTGIEGIELAFNRALRGKPVEVLGIRDQKGQTFLVNGAVDPKLTAGDDVMLTLDGILTHKTQKALAEAVKTHNAKGAVAVVMDPRNGDILAMASVPTYDPTNPKDALAREVRNRAITDTFEPGSTMKTFTFAAALETGKFDPWKTWFDCQNGTPMFVGGHKISDDHPKGVVIGADVFKHSLNIGTVKIAWKYLSRESLHETHVKLGFGARASVGLGGEVPGIARLAKSESAFATHSYGYSLAVTPLQMAAAYAVIASDGMYRPPRLVRAIVHPDGRQEPLRRPEGARGEQRVFSEKTAVTMRNLMQQVVDDGTAQKAQIPGYRVGGKTGTAVKHVGGKYVKGSYISSFCGIVPLNAPRFVICVAVDDPRPVYYGGQVAAPAFKQIAEEALTHAVIPPTEPIVQKPGDAKVAALSGPAAISAHAVERMGYEAPAWEVVPGEDATENAALAEGETESAPPEVIIPETVDVPSFDGMSVGQAIRAAAKLGLELHPSGSGVAFAQQPAPGPVVRGTACKVSFRPPGG